MKPGEPCDSRSPHPDDHCLVHSVADALAAEPALEAVTIDRSERRIAVATLGRVNDQGLGDRIANTVRRAEEMPGEQRCCLLEGHADCRECVWPDRPVERDGLVIKQEASRMTISRVTCPTAPRFWRWSDVPWPKLVPRQVEIPEDESELDEWKPQLAAAVACGVCGLAGYFFADTQLSLACYLGAYVAGGCFAATEALERLRQRSLDVHFLMLTVALGSAAIGAWGEGAVLLFLFSFSGALEHYAMGRTQREIRSLFRHAPKVATLLDEQGQEREIAVDQLRPGHRLLIRPDAQFPVDAEVCKGTTASDESNLTGEAAPVEKGVGDTVLAGTLNLWGSVEAIVLRPSAESSLEKIIRLIREAQHLKAPAQRFTDKFGTGYTYAILGLSVAMFFVWWLAFGLAPFRSTVIAHSAFYHAMTLLVVASPCALVLSIPSAILAAIAWGARRGILFRGGAAVEKLAQVKLVAMDKTGTLTTGEMQVERVESYPPGQESKIASLAFSLERFSSHPIARAITRYGKQKAITPAALDRFESLTGAGVQAQHQGRPVRLGRREWLVGLTECTEWAKTVGPALPSLPPLEPGSTEVWLVADGLAGRILLRDAIRPQARQVVASLHELGLHLIVLTGDRPEAAQALKAPLGLQDVRAGLRPEHKVAAIKEIEDGGQRVAMIGDGVNDAPSLAAAYVGVAMGARGSDAALEQADIVLMHDRLENFQAAFQLSQRACQIIRQNLFISLGTVVVLVSFALFGAIPLTLGVIGHEGSTVVVVMNSLRLLFLKVK